MPSWDSGLSGVHREIAADTSPRLHVLAGPGTGKTFAMMRRIARLLEGDVSPDKLLAITFTRTAARDLKEQLAGLGTDGSNDVVATTLHSLCFRILSTQNAFAFTQRNPRPLLAHEISCLEDDIAHEFGGKRRTRKLLAAYEAAWARLQRDDPGYAPTPDDQRFETTLLAWLRFHSAMLIGELVPLTLAFLRANPQLPVLPSLSHVLVDEYQDLNKADQALAQALAGTGSLLVIGDDNQSIYSFRHANPEGVRTFPSEVAGTVEYAITECRRCPPNIVDLSNSLISHDPNTTRPCPLTADHDRPNAEVYVVQHSTLEEEVTSTADYVNHFLSQHPDVPPGRVLILTPRRFIGNAIKDALIRRGRNALSYFQEDALADGAAAEGFCLLSLLANQDDRAAIRAWLGFGSQDHRRRPYARVRRHCESTGETLRSALTSLASGTLSLPHAGQLIDRWNELQLRLAHLQTLPPLALVDDLWPLGNPDLTDIRDLAGAIALYDPSVQELLDALREAITQPELPPSDSDIIQIMSLHKSKGLTRDVVIIAGCMAGTLPRVDPLDPPEVQNQQLEEQRRLFYVGITRATKVLVISAASTLPLADALRSGATIVRKTFNTGHPLAITAFSSFIGELGPTAPPTQTTATWRNGLGIPQVAVSPYS